MQATQSSKLQSGITDMAIRAQERRARRLLLQGNLDTAMAVYHEILELSPDYANAHFQLGLCYRQRRQWSEAAAALQQAHILGDDRAEPLLSEMRATAPNLVPAPPTDDVEDDASPAVVVGGQVMTLTQVPADAAGVLTEQPPEPPIDMAPPEVEVGHAPPGTHTVSEPRAVYVARNTPLEARDAAEEAAQRPILCPPLDDVFALGGPLAASLGARYRPRPGQVQMASLIRDALQGRQHAVIEAGTGIGKSFAYLIPVLWSGAPAVVSTSNKGLMNQLWEKDIPRLQQIAPRKTKAALLKGRGNYVCRRQLERLQTQVGHPDQDKDMKLIRDGLAREPSGDMERMGLPPALAARLRATSRECKGRRCPHFDTCFYEQAKREAAKADVVVTNHAMLCHNALLFDNHILPVRPALIIDEAHQLTHYAIDALTQALEHDQFWGLLNSGAVRGAVENPTRLQEAQVAYQDLFRAVARLRPGAGRAGHRPTRWALTGELQPALALSDALRALESVLSHAPGIDEAEQESTVMQVEELALTADALAVPEPDSHIRLCELTETASPERPDAYEVTYRPLEVSAVLRRMLFDAWPRVICTSATLGVGKDLGWYRRQVGLVRSNGDRPVISETLGSPFDYDRQMLLYTPRSLTPVYNEKRQAFAKSYVEQLTDEVARLLEASRGRALVLCTSRARMRQLYDTLAPALRGRYPCYLQGEMSQPKLVRNFKRDGNAILFATRGFWEGLDIPGDALAMVILDKIPFVPFNDPVIQKQDAQIRARGGNPFYDLQLASAILSLRQGAGRLIRSEDDRGVIALLDARVLRKRYGRQIIRSLPEGCHTTDFEDVVAFLRDKD